MRILLMLVSPAWILAGTASQTDWSGGDGVPGPVIDWGNAFSATTGIDCFSIPSDIYLLRSDEEHTVRADYVQAVSVYSADVNGDGYIDILGASVGADDVTWWENVDGSGTNWVEHTVDGDFDYASSVYCADVDGDGHMDVLASAMIAGDITWWENVDGSGTSWAEHTVDGDFGWATSVYTSDINGDGHMDVLGASTNQDDITWWENVDGSGTGWVEHVVDGDFDGARSVSSADINGDGDMDVLGAAGIADDITWWENVNGSGNSWVKQTVDGDFAYATSVHTSDINGDGFMDVLGTACDADDITWWENVNGSGTSWVEHTVDGDFDGACSVFASDVDGDGWMDVLGAACDADDITWWENMDGSGTSWTEHAVDGDFDYAISVHSSDVDGDGYVDILGAAYYADDIAWWDHLPLYVSSGSLESSVLNVQEIPDWQAIDWISTEPYGTSVAFQVRASDDPSGMGAWSDTLASPSDLSGHLTAGDDYLQYRAILTTTDRVITPVLDDVTVTWLVTGIEDESAAVDALVLYGALRNPSFGGVTLLFSLPADSWVELTVHDLSGRVIRSVRGEYAQGVHEIVLDDLACGAYLARMESGACVESRPFVVFE
jgi:hypothetical protein